MKKLYVSGGMSGLKDNNVPAFNKAAKALRKKGYRIVSPPELDRVSKHRTWEGFLRRDIGFLVQCDGVATLNGWKKSRGANLEIFIAKALSMEVHPVRYYL